MKISFKKNDLVKLKISSHTALENKIETFRKISVNELIRWHSNPANRGLDDAGETRLPPDSVVIKYEPGTLMIVSRAKISPVIGYRNKKNMCELLDPENGAIVWVSRESVECT